jgi:hypothetical protein
LQLRLPAHVVEQIPFAIDPVVRSLWAFGFIPMLSGIGHVIAGLSIKVRPQKQIQSPDESPLRIDEPRSRTARSDAELTTGAIHQTPTSVTERTTNILDRDPQWQK